MNRQEWEDLCDGCGKCCSFPGGEFACPSLDVQTNRCTTYDTRRTRHTCVDVLPTNVLALHANGTLPNSCAYVRNVFHKPPVRQKKTRKIFRIYEEKTAEEKEAYKKDVEFFQSRRADVHKMFEMQQAALLMELRKVDGVEINEDGIAPLEDDNAMA